MAALDIQVLVSDYIKQWLYLWQLRTSSSCLWLHNALTTYGSFRYASSCFWLHNALSTYGSFRCLCSCLITQGTDYTYGNFGHPGGCLWPHKALATYGSFRYLSSESVSLITQSIDYLWQLYISKFWVHVSDHTKHWIPMAVYLRQTVKNLWL